MESSDTGCSQVTGTEITGCHFSNEHDAARNLVIVEIMELSDTTQVTGDH